MSKHNEEQIKGRVLIEVRGGVANYFSSGDVDVCLIDWDSIEAGDEPPANYERFADLRAGLQEDIDGEIAFRESYFLR